MVDGTKGSHRKEGTTKMSEDNINAAGIDTGKAKLDVALAGGKARLQIDNALSGWRELATWVKRHNVDPIGIEARGGAGFAGAGNMPLSAISRCTFPPPPHPAPPRPPPPRGPNTRTTPTPPTPSPPPP